MVCYLIYDGMALGKKGGLFGDSNYTHEILTQIDDGLVGKQAAEASATFSVDMSAADGPSIPKKGRHVIMFHSDSCGHCKIAAPHFRTLAGRFKKAQLRMCDDKCLRALSPEDQKMASVQGFPTFCAFHDGVRIHRQVGAPGGEKEIAAMCDKMFP